MDEINELSISAFARRIGCTQSYVSQLKLEGRLVLSSDGKKILAAESQERIAATRDPSKAAVADRHARDRGANLATGALQADATASPEPPADAAVASNPRYQEARATREYFAALREQRDFERDTGKLLVAKEVEDVVVAAMTVLRTRLESLGAVLGPQLAATSDPATCASLVSAEVEHALGEVSRRFAGLGKGEAANA